MANWRSRHELSLNDRVRRSYYELLRDELEQFLLEYSLVDSYFKFCGTTSEYPFVQKRELKPRARIPDVEYECQNTFLVIFVEDVLPNQFKKYIHFFDFNRTTKTNLLRSETLPIPRKIFRHHKYLESEGFFKWARVLLPVDYALLIQRDPAAKSRDRYSLTHFHVRIDWPTAEAAEDLARYLRYISKDLYEKGDKYAEELQKKFFEYYGLPYLAGGRRTAGIVAAQYLRRLTSLASVYVGSSESRMFMKVTEAGVTRAVLMTYTDDEIAELAGQHKISQADFRDVYVLSRSRKENVCIFQVAYAPTAYARPPEDGRLRQLETDKNFLTVGSQLLLPLPGNRDFPPLPVNTIYAS